MIVSRALGLSLLAACCAAWPAASAQAAVIFDSLGDAANGTGSINNTLEQNPFIPAHTGTR